MLWLGSVDMGDGRVVGRDCRYALKSASCTQISRNVCPERPSLKKHPHAAKPVNAHGEGCSFSGIPPANAAVVLPDIDFCLQDVRTYQIMCSAFPEVAKVSPGSFGDRWAAKEALSGCWMPDQSFRMILKEFDSDWLRAGGRQWRSLERFDRCHIQARDQVMRSSGHTDCVAVALSLKGPPQGETCQSGPCFTCVQILESPPQLRAPLPCS